MNAKRIDWPELLSSDSGFLRNLVSTGVAQVTGRWQPWSYGTLGDPISMIRVSVSVEISCVYTEKISGTEKPTTLMVGVSPSLDLKIEGSSDCLLVGIHETRVAGDLMFDWDNPGRFTSLCANAAALGEFVALVAAGYLQSQRKLDLLAGRLLV